MFYNQRLCAARPESGTESWELPENASQRKTGEYQSRIFDPLHDVTLFFEPCHYECRFRAEDVLPEIY